MLALIIFLVIGLVFLAIWLLMLLWNFVCPDLFGLPSITYWQMWGLFLLINGLFAGGWFSGAKD